MNNQPKKLITGPTGKASKAELQRRIAIIQDLISRKMRESEILEHVRVNYHSEWRTANSTVKKYIRLAKEDIVKQIKRNGAAIYAEAVMDMNYLYKKALEEGDLRAALAIRKEKSTLLNVYSMNGKEEVEENTDSDAELEEMIRDVTSSDWTTDGKQRAPRVHGPNGKYVSQK